MEPLDILLGGCVSLSLLRGHVDEDRTVQILHLIEDPDELGHIVAVDRAEIPEPEGFEEHSRRQHVERRRDIVCLHSHHVAE